MRNLLRFVLPVALAAALLWWVPWRDFTDSVDVAPGFRAYRADHYRLAYPVDWQVKEGTDPSGRPRVEFNGPANEKGAYSAQVRVVTAAGWGYRLEDKVTQFQAAASRGGYQVLDAAAVTVRGARSAYRFEIVTRTKTATGASVRLRGVRMLILSEERTLVEVSAEAPEEGEGQALLPRVLKSIRVDDRRGLL
ncbi:hypothetical protein [Actinomadura sp. 9N407]|uniref:hypothetical protein n=1 Tax=Actinomadura sp. 9N407 TaxID=3375154 RepID=UPI0037A23232